MLDTNNIGTCLATSPSKGLWQIPDASFFLRRLPALLVPFALCAQAAVPTYDPATGVMNVPGLQVLGLSNQCFDVGFKTKTLFPIITLEVATANLVSCIAPTPPLQDTVAPTMPTSLNAQAINATRIDLAWTASTDNVGVAKYQVFRAGSPSALAETTLTGYSDTTVSGNTSYSYQVKALDAANNASVLSSTATIKTPAADTGLGTVSYDFSAGDTLASKGGWSFSDTNWKLSTVPGTSTVGMEFSCPASQPGKYCWPEQRFAMPAANGVWMKFRLHIPAQYAHRFDTFIGIPASAIQTWQIGDQVRGTDGQTLGVISSVVLAPRDDIAQTGIFLRNPHAAWSNDLWVGTLRNVTRDAAAVSTSRAMWPDNRKLLALWTDGYSAYGLGSSVVWEFWDSGAPDNQTATGSNLTVHYSTGNYTGTGAHLGSSTFITSADRGKYIDVMVHVQLSTTAGAKNGVLQTWLRRQGQSQFTQIHNITDADMDPRPKGNKADSNHVGKPTDLQPFQRGYLMGWQNSGYDEAVSFHISRIDYYQQRPAELN